MAFYCGKINLERVKIKSMFVDILQIIGYYIAFVCINERLKPAYQQAQVSRAEKSAEVPQKMVGFLHALITSAYGVSYAVGWIDFPQLHTARLISTAFLCFDFVSSVINYERDGDESIMAHPAGTGLHHLITIIFIYGALFASSLAGCLAFFWSEIPVCFLNMTWYYFYIGQSHKRECAILSMCTIVTYFIFRVCMFPLMFLFVMLPNMNLFNPFSYLAVPLLVLVYLLNVHWFVKLLSKTARLLPNLYDVQILARLPVVGVYFQT